MNLTQITLDIGACMLIVASIPLIRTVYAHRRRLTSFHRIGSLLTLTANALFVLSGLSEQAYVLVASSSMNVVLWGLATVYSWRKRGDDQ